MSRARVSLPVSIHARRRGGRAALAALAAAALTASIGAPPRAAAAPAAKPAAPAPAAKPPAPAPAPAAKPAAPPARPTLSDRIAQAAFPIAVDHARLAGKGADVLRAAVADAHFVMLGEDHGIAQIPALGGALCAELAPHGFHHLALEVGPSVAPTLAAVAAAPSDADAAAQLAAFTARYPETIAFYDWKQELGFVRACGAAVAAAATDKGAPALDVWGLDQELMGAAGLVLDQILATRPGAKATAALRALRAENDTDRAAAVAAHDFGKLFLLRARSSALTAAAALLAKEGTAPAQAQLAALLLSRAIYQGQMGPTPYLSNRERARLMKRTFIDDLSAAAHAEGALPKVFLKLGAYHLYRGLDPLRSSELGDLVDNAAEGHGVTAVNVLALGLRGTQLAITAPGVPASAVPLDLTAADSDFAFLAPLVAHQAATGWTLFDLRALRPTWSRADHADPELERLVFGYDFLVVIPDPVAEDPTP